MAIDVDQLRRALEQLRKDGHLDELKRELLRIGREALKSENDPEALHAKAELLQDFEEFGFARRLMRRARKDRTDPYDRKRQRREALFTYKDLELAAGPRLDRALEILGEGAPLAESGDAEWLGLAGAILKRSWQQRGSSEDLDRARWCYLKGWKLTGDPERCYPGINAAFVLDQLARLREDSAVVPSPEPEALREHADDIRREIVELIGAQAVVRPWDLATLAEAHLGLGMMSEAKQALEAYRVHEDVRDWWMESTATQLMALADHRKFGPEAREVLRRLVPERAMDPAQLATGKLGLALSGGGFRASLFHIGVLARLTELDVLRRVEVLSCVSGGSILGAFYYLKLRRLLQSKQDADIKPEDLVALVAELSREMLDAVQGNLRVRMFARVRANARMMRSNRFSRTDEIARLYQERIFALIDKDNEEDKTPWRMSELVIAPADSRQGFSPAWGNWRRGAKVPILVLNATTVNTGHAWQFTATWMGEPPMTADEEIDANSRLRRVYYNDAPAPHNDVTLGTAVAASACVPTLFPPVTLQGLYDNVTVQLVDGGVHDNQGIASLLEQDCATIIVSDASGQMGELADPKVSLASVALRTNSMLSARVRAAQFADLGSRLRSKALRGLVLIHMRKGLATTPRDWHDCQDPYVSKDDVVRTLQDKRRAAYGIDPDVQRALSELRTDLDAFADDEALALMAAGYKMAHFELASSLPGAPAEDVPTLDWIFTPALDGIGRPGGGDGTRRRPLPRSLALLQACTLAVGATRSQAWREPGAGGSGASARRSQSGVPGAGGRHRAVRRRRLVGHARVSASHRPPLHATPTHAARRRPAGGMNVPWTATARSAV